MRRETLLLAAVLAVAGVPVAAATGTEIRHVPPAGSDAEGVNPVPLGDPMVVEGVTILQPAENAITVDLYDDGDLVASSATDEWGRDGVWRVELDTTRLSTGTYRLVADDGVEVDGVTVRIVPAATATPTETPATASTPTPTPTATPTATAGPSTPAATAASTPSTTDGDGSGFGPAVALVALTVVAGVLRGRS
jgi:hypothetical protein